MKKLFEMPKIEVLSLDVEDIMLDSIEDGDYELGEDELPPF